MEEEGADAFTSICDENAARRVRPRGPGYQSQAEKNRMNRLALAETLGDREWAGGPSGGGEKIDVVMGSDKNGLLQDPAAPAKHFRSIDSNVEEIERRMMQDAPKPPQQDEYKIEDVFDQSYKELLRDDHSMITKSIAVQGTGTSIQSPSGASSSADDEFDF
eukprot:RCo028311